MLDPDQRSLNADPKHWLIFPLYCSPSPGSSWAECSPSAASSYSSSSSSTPSGPHRSTTCKLQSSFVDPHHLDADPDSTYHPDADPNADPDSFLFICHSHSLRNDTDFFHFSHLFYKYSRNLLSASVVTRVSDSDLDPYVSGSALMGSPVSGSVPYPRVKKLTLTNKLDF
jgi:hypothetical protein